MEYRELSKMIDQALLSPTMTIADLERGIDLAIAYDVASVCIMPYHLARCSEKLSGTEVQSSTTIGFPHGVHAAEIKVAEAKKAIEDGCQELDMVINISQVLSGDWNAVQDEIAAVIDVAHCAKQKVKVIFENCYLNDPQKIKLCKICTDLKADWVKTSTGYGTSGATHEDLKLMREHAGPDVQVKAAGGVRTLESLIAVKELGVTRCGASRTSDILDPLREQLGLPKIEVPTIHVADANPNY